MVDGKQPLSTKGSTGKAVDVWGAQDKQSAASVPAEIHARQLQGWRASIMRQELGCHATLNPKTLNPKCAGTRRR